MSELLVVEYLRGGGTYESLLAEHAVHAKPHNGKVSFVYDQIAARDENPIAQQCRGLVLREHTHEVVAYPFNRFFNLGQGAAATVDMSTARFEEKLDGTLLIVYWDDRAGRWMCATRSMCEAHGNINGSQATFAHLADACVRGMGTGAATLHDLMDGVGADRGVTHMFELTGPHNRIVCEYAALHLTLLGARRLSDFAEIEPRALESAHGFDTARTWSFASIADLIEVIREWKPSEYEGVIVKDAHFNRVKVKTPQYVAAARATDSLGASWRNVCEAIQTGHADDLLGIVPPHVRERIESLRPAIASLVAKAESDYAELRGIDDMKAFAAEAKTRMWPAILFALKRGKAVDASEFMADASADTVLDLCRAQGWSEPDEGLRL